MSTSRLGPWRAPPYAELHARSAFSLLDGASAPEAIVARAAAVGLAGLAVLDRDDVGGAVRLHRAAREAEVTLVHGATLTMEDESALPVLVVDRLGWANLCRLLTDARMHGRRGSPRTSWDALGARSAGLIVLTGGAEGAIGRALARGDEAAATRRLRGLIDAFGRERVLVEAARHGMPWEDALAEASIAIAASVGVEWVPTNDVRYATPTDRRAYDVMTCLRHQVTLDEAGTRLLPNDSWAVRSPAAMAAIWRGHEGALARTARVAARCVFGLDDLRPSLPAYDRDAAEHGQSDDALLRHLVALGGGQRYGPSLTARQRDQIDHELRVIAQLGLAGYFLIVHDIVEFARARQILMQGRGSAANSAVCYCLGITAIDPIGMDLLFERFLSEARTDPPDIDIDISHMDREVVLQYVYQRYGRRHAAMVCEQITWRGRSAVRDVARVLGFEPEVGDRLSLQVGHAEAAEAADHLEAGGAAACGLDLASPRVRALIDAVRRLDRLPRHRSIHVGGFVLTREPLDTVVPIEPASMHERTVIQWDKDDLPPIGLVKIDLLGLGILTVLDKAIRYVREGRGVHLDLAHLPMDDPAVFRQLGAADTVGLFQVESRAQMNVLPRLRPERFYDIVVQVALIRPGPIQGEMVHPYIRRRRGEEPITYLHPDLVPVLERTLGVPLFQEQGMKVAIAMAGFTADKADRLRKVLGHKRATDHLRSLVKDLWDGMMARGVDEDVALRILAQLEGFASYGFPESHAASFALLTWASAYIRHHFAPEYLAAILNAQPMGFYSAGTLVADAQRHGVEVRPLDMVFSGWETSLEPDIDPPAVRLGLRLVRGLSTRARGQLESALEHGPLASLDDLVRRADQAALPDKALLVLARAGAFRTLWPGRREALWELLRRIRERRSPLDLHGPSTPSRLPSMTLIEETAADYAFLGLSHETHPMAFYRAELDARGVVPSSHLRQIPNRQRVAVAGLVTCRQRPASARGVFFMTLEDEHGMINVVVMPDVFERQRVLLAGTSAMVVQGVLEHEQSVINVLGTRFYPLTPQAQGGGATQGSSARAAGRAGGACTWVRATSRTSRK